MYHVLCDSLQLYTPFSTLRSSSDNISHQLLMALTRLSTIGSNEFSVFALPVPLRKRPPVDPFKSNLMTFFLILQNNKLAVVSLSAGLGLFVS